jgi:hypothetical protein
MRTVVRLLALLALGGLLSGLAAGLARPGTDLRAPEPTAPTALVWGNGLFFNRPAFNRWLRQHNKSYADWGPLHPRARGILENLVQPVRFKALPTRDRRMPVFTLPGQTKVSRVGKPLLFGLAAFGLVLLLVSALPVRRLAPASALAAVISERRIGVSASGIAIFVGILIAKLAGS